ncbi:hypothetical protein [Chryseobacterium koreense]|uniref:hypothetical protein n=1 Tax=Chryseobacterium koreense TaxID=232216 RepID=UPI0026F28A4B|nr:hypothetical protein [Chryseobacterium koreense]
MNILFAYDLSETDNQFVQIHIRLLQELGCEVTVSMDQFWNPTRTYDYMVINWPECFFDWKPNISDEQVQQLNASLKRWKRGSTRIITFLHDEYSHFGRGANLNLLFDLCYRHSDVLIHLGNYSKNKYTNLYPDSQHHLIYHPLYTDFQTDLGKHAARIQLGVTENVYLVFVPGGIRKPDEVDYCLEIYRRLPVKNKQLIFQKTNFLAKPQSLKSFIDLKVWGYYLFHMNKFKLLENIGFLRGFMEKDVLSAYFAASDLIIIPRTDILNSGNILLAAQFGKPMIGSGAGNMGEMLMILGQQCADPQFIDKHITTVPENNPDQIKHAVERYANNDVIKKQWLQILKP